MGESRSPRWAGAANGLTLLRLAIAVSLVPLVSNGLWTVVSAALALAWLSDFLDGRLARLSGGPTRLAGWDMPADTAVGAGLVLGMVGHGTLDAVIGWGALVVFGALYALGNVAASMLLQLTGYLPTLVILWSDRPSLWWAPFATMVLIGVVDWRRLLLINIPAFLRGIAGRFEGRSPGSAE